jgi:hypothetical protein
MNPGKLVTASILFLSVTFFSITDAHAKILVKSSTNPVATDSTRVLALMKRLEEIKSMDFAAMSPREKREIRKEVRSLTKEVRDINGRGIYISAAGIVIIILLLILLL